MLITLLHIRCSVGHGPSGLTLFSWTTSLLLDGSCWNEPDLLAAFHLRLREDVVSEEKQQSFPRLPSRAGNLSLKRRKATISSVTTNSDSHITAMQVSSTRLSCDQHQWKVWKVSAFTVISRHCPVPHSPSCQGSTNWTSLHVIMQRIYPVFPPSHAVFPGWCIIQIWLYPSQYSLTAENNKLHCTGSTSRYLIDWKGFGVEQYCWISTHGFPDSSLLRH